ncbi:ester cyclase [Paenibacillus sp. GCM10027627]|uniref:ester cyclase n=1 Tax=unclassified Paenibacillus TaxID=185978 RepID=UPI003640A4AA
MYEQNREAVQDFIADLSNRSELEITDQFFVEEMKEAFSNWQWELADCLAEQAEATARIIITAKHTGTFAGHAATGKVVNVTQFREFHLKDGQITAHRGWFDTGTLLPQLQS